MAIEYTSNKARYIMRYKQQVRRPIVSACVTEHFIHSYIHICVRKFVSVGVGNILNLLNKVFIHAVHIKKDAGLPAVNLIQRPCIAIFFARLRDGMDRVSKDLPVTG